MEHDVNHICSVTIQIQIEPYTNINQQEIDLTNSVNDLWLESKSAA